MYKYIKRGLDIILSFVALIVLSPIFLIIVIAIKLDSKGPAVFTQIRLGKDNKEFKIYKFRTMYTTAPKNVSTEEFTDAASYVTKVGKFLRMTSFDETSQFFNVLKGDMSIIGPRPLILNIGEWLTLREKSGANRIRPGITGLAQINGRDDISAECKAAYDTEYYKNLSFALDVKIFFKTFSHLIDHRDYNAPQNSDDKDE